MSGQPKTRSEELIARINALSSKDCDNTVLLKSLERQAKQVLDVDAIEGYVLLGAVAALRGDIDDMRQQHERAIKLAPHNQFSVHNYAVSLSKTGLVEEAREMALRGWNLGPQDADNLLLLIKVTAETGRFLEAHSLMRQQTNLLPNAAQDRAGQLSAAARLLRTCEVDDTSVNAVTRIAFEIARRRGIRVVEVEDRIASDDESQWIDYVLKVDTDVSEIIDMNEELAECLAEASSSSDVDRVGSVFVARFSSLATSNGSNSN